MGGGDTDRKAKDQYRREMNLWKERDPLNKVKVRQLNYWQGTEVE